MLKSTKPKLHRLILIFGCILVVLLSCIATAAGEGTHIRRTIRIGSFAQDGINMKDENGKLLGYNTDLWKLARRYMDYRLEFVGYDKTWQDMLQMLQDGEVDILINAQKSPEREALFAFSQPTGVTSGLLNVRADNSKFIAGNYSTYNGMHIGAFRDDQTFKLFEKWAQSKVFTYKVTFYDSSDHLYDAFHKGEVEAIIANAFRKPQGERTLDMFFVNNIYAIVRKDDTKLLADFNYALEQMNANDGDWVHKLLYRYASENNVPRLSFSDRERELIRQYQSGEKQLVVTCWTDRAPISYVEDGKLKGILPDIFELIMKKANIPYTVKIAKSSEEYEKMCLDGSVDAIIDWRHDNLALADNRDYSTTSNILDARLTLLKRNDLKEAPQIFAVERRYGLPNAEEKLVHNSQIFWTNSVEESIKAVADGKADATYLYYYMVLYHLNQKNYNNLSYEIIDKLPLDFHIAFTQGVNHELSGLLSKCIRDISYEERNQIINKYTNYSAKDMDFLTYIMHNPKLLFFFFAVILAASLCFLFLYTRLHEKKRLLVQEQAYAVSQAKLAEEAQAANKSKTNFLFNMSHDIRTPMNAIIGFANLAQNTKCTTEQIHAYLGKILVASHHLLSLINDILEMSRIESGKITLDRTPTSWSETMQEIHTIMQEQIDSKHQHFSISISPLANDIIMIDKLRLEQVLVNLISNASKYTPEGGSISVELEQKLSRETGYADYRITVTDNGMGMSEDFVKRIFTPFERANNSTVSKIQGTGLGMSITKSILDLAGAKISVKSKLGEGTEITVSNTVRLCTDAEIAARAAQKQQSLESEISQADFKGKRILLVEDNKLNREIASTMLAQTGLIVESAEDGSVAVEMVQGSAPGYYDLILMDIQMPIMDGYEATKKIRALSDKRLAQIPIVALSANAFEEDKKASLAAGMDGHIAKPINMHELLIIMHKFINK